MWQVSKTGGEWDGDCLRHNSQEPKHSLKTSFPDRFNGQFVRRVIGRI